MRALALLLVTACSVDLEPPSTSEVSQAALCTDGETRPTETACGPGYPQIGTVTEVCSGGAWVPKACEVPIHETELCELPDFTPSDLDIVVTPTSHTGWYDVLADFVPGTRQILLTPGDYRPWGLLSLGPTSPSGTPGSPLVIRYHDPETEAAHPAIRSGSGDEALVQGILWWGGAKDWVAHGLTIREPSLATPGLFSILGPGADRIIVDYSLVEDSGQQAGIRIHDSTDACAQRNVIRRSTAHNDGVGIQLKPVSVGVSRAKVLANEIYDWPDAVAATNYNGLPVDFRIEGNDLYVTPRTYRLDPETGTQYACNENAIDIKAGHPTLKSTILHNRIWGFRETPPAGTDLCGENFPSGSAGDAIVVHFDAKRVVIKGNTFGDAVHVLRDAPGERLLEFHWNYVYGIPGTCSNVRWYSGAVFVPAGGGNSIISNRFAFTPLLCPQSLSYVPTALPTVTGNGFIGPVNVGVCTGGANWPQSNPYAYRYERRRWTGPEWVTIEGGYR